MVDLRKNLAKHKLQAGQPVLVPGIGPNSIPDADFIDMLGPLGVVDVVWVEMEHGPTTWAHLSDLSRACDLWGITSLVRVSTAEPYIIGRTLDRGIQSVLVPHVSTKEAAQEVVQAALYAPKGLRGMAGPRQGYGVADYHQKANDEIMVVVLLEEMEAIQNLQDILTVDGIDCFFVAPSDLAQTMGPQYLNQPNHPEVQSVVEQAIKQIVAAGKGAGTLVNEDNLEHYLGLGVRFLRFSAAQYLIRGLQGFRDQAASKVPGGVR